MEGPTVKRRKIQPTESDDTSISAESPDTLRGPDDRENLAEDFIPRCSLITSNIFKYLSAKDLLSLSRVSRKWFTACREYLRLHQKDLHCPLVLDKVDGLEALDRAIEVLNTPILDQQHPFTGVYFKFTDAFDDFFIVGRGPTKRPAPLPSVDIWESFNQSLIDENSPTDDIDYEQHDYTQDYETFDSWMYDNYEAAAERRRELEKVNGPLRRIFDKINPIKHVYMLVDYGGGKRSFNGEKFQRFISLLPLQQIEYFRTNLRISEFIHKISPGQLSNLKSICIDELINAQLHTLNQLFAACPALEKWTSPVPANMVSAFGSKRYLITSLLLTKFLPPGGFEKILNANLMLTELVANSSKCPIGKSSYPDIIRLIQNNGDTLKVIHMSGAFIKYVVDSDLAPMSNVQKLIIRSKSSKATKIKASVKFPNAVIIAAT